MLDGGASDEGTGSWNAEKNIRAKFYFCLLVLLVIFRGAIQPTSIASTMAGHVSSVATHMASRLVFNQSFLYFNRGNRKERKLECGPFTKKGFILCSHVTTMATWRTTNAGKMATNSGQPRELQPCRFPIGLLQSINYLDYKCSN